MAALFTFVGCTGGYLLQMKPSERRLVSTIIFCFSLFCLVGLIGGVSTKVNRLLDATGSTGAGGTVYLKSQVLSDLDLINLKYTQHLIPAEEAYRLTWTEIQQSRTAKE